MVFPGAYKYSLYFIMYCIYQLYQPCICTFATVILMFSVVPLGTFPAFRGH